MAKLIRLIVVFAVLGGICFSAITLTPPEKVKEIKAQVREWLKPGAVLQEYIPFEIPGLDDKPAAPAVSQPESQKIES